MASATRTISTDGRRAKALVSASATIGMITNIATSDRPSSPGSRNTPSTSPGVARRPKLKTVIRMLACRASMTACCNVIVDLGRPEPAGLDLQKSNFNPSERARFGIHRELPEGDATVVPLHEKPVGVAAGPADQATLQRRIQTPIALFERREIHGAVPAPAGLRIPSGAPRTRPPTASASAPERRCA